MLTTLMVALLLFAAGTVVLASGIFAWQADYKALTNKVFFLITIALAVWSYGMGSSTIAPDAARGEIWRRIAALGWGTVYALTLHFNLIITGKAPSLRKWRFYLALYLPAFLTVVMFAVPNRLNPCPYHLLRTEYGWTNVPCNNLWDWIFYVYYIGFTLVGLGLLYRWGKETTDPVTQKKARIMIRALLLALVLGTSTDLVLNSLFSALPQMAPVVMLIPTLSIFHILQKDSFNITEGLDKNTSYLVLFTSVFIYIFLAAAQALTANHSLAFGAVVLEDAVFRGVMVQIQMFISLYLVLKENRPGYIAAVLMNLIGLISALTFFLRSGLLSSLAGIIAYAGVLVIITLIKSYKEKNRAYIKKINTQAVREEFYSNVFKQAPVGIAIFSDTEYAQNEKFVDVSINPAYERIVGRTKEELKKINWTEITHPDDLSADLEYFNQFKQGKIDAYSREKRYIKPDGSEVWVDMQVSRFTSANENPGDHVCIITDITERKKIEAILKYNSEHVPVTGVYNRSVLEKVLASDATLPASAKRALVGVNLFAMHGLSVRYGYYYNQAMRKKIADTLKAFCNEQALLFDTNDYRFVYYVKNYANESELTALGQKVAEKIDSHLYVHGIEFGIGVLPIDQLHTRNPEEILKKLMNTSELAVKRGRKSSNLLFYSPEIDQQITRENEISQEIREIAAGIKTDRLYLQYQPIVDLAAKKICGFEALARLNSAKHGLIPPLEFIAIAEKTHMIAPFGEEIIHQALCFLKKLKENGYDRIAVCINISVLQMLEEGFADKLFGRIKALQVNPENVGIELTESVFATEQAELNKVIGRLKAAGLKVLIDDFGTGYSSFARQRELNIDCLKIDKSFIDRLLALKPEEAITGDIISMAHKLGRCVVAEGVEDIRQLRYLQAHGCDWIQGYIIAKPLDEEAALAFLSQALPIPTQW